LGSRRLAHATFTLEELKLAVEVASSAGIPVSAHATSTEGMRRAILAGVETIEHGDGGTPEIFRLMKEHGTALCPTLSVASGPNIDKKKVVFKQALDAGVTIAAAAMSACSPTAITRARSRRWSLGECPCSTLCVRQLLSMPECCTWKIELAASGLGC